MKIYLLAGFDLKVEFDNESFYMKEKDIFYCEDVLSCSIKISPYCCDGELSGYEIHIDNNIKNEDNNCIQTIKIRNNEYLILLKPLIYYNPLQLENHIIKFNDYVEQICFYNQKYSLLQVFCKKEKYQVLFSDKNLTIEHFTKTISEKSFLFIKVFNEKRQYYIIFSKNSCIYNGLVKEINIKDNHLIIMKDDVNCFGQKNVIDYDVKEDAKNEFLVYYDKRPVFTNINILYLFMDAVKIKNYELCKLYLSDDLLKIDSQDLFEFLGDFNDYCFIDNNCVLQKNFKVMKIVHFEVFNEVISNIYD